MRIKKFYAIFLSKPARWLCLIILSFLVTILFHFAALPAFMLLGPMISAIFLGCNHIDIKVSPTLFVMAQGIIGCMIAQTVTNEILLEIAQDWIVFLSGVTAVIFAATFIGYLLAKKQIFPGTTAIWGCAPGAASAMVLMAEAYGADTRLVAIMQYMRVVFVVVIGTILALFLEPTGPLAVTSPIELSPDVYPQSSSLWLVVTIFLAIFCSVGAKYLRIPAGGMFAPFIVAVILQNTGLITLILPPWLLAGSYILIGWGVGLRFTRPILVHARHFMPILLLSTLSLIAICGLFALILSYLTKIDLLTAYLATSPGGADSVSIIAKTTIVDVHFVVAYQTMRFLLVTLTGPLIARFSAKLLNDPPR